MGIKSPDLNPIENVWSIMKASIYAQNPKDEHELKLLIQDEWNILDNNCVSELATGMSDRIIKLINKGGTYIGH